jgi:hypothetical protein
VLKHNENYSKISFHLKKNNPQRNDHEKKFTLIMRGITQEVQSLTKWIMHAEDRQKLPFIDIDKKSSNGLCI